MVPSSWVPDAGAMSSVAIETARCTGCTQVKPVTEFNWKVKGRTRQSRCKGCMRDYQARYYEQNKTAAAQRTAKRKATVASAKREVLAAAMAERGCWSCRSRDAATLSCHHPTVTSVATMAATGSSDTSIVTLVTESVVACDACWASRDDADATIAGLNRARTEHRLAQDPDLAAAVDAFGAGGVVDVTSLLGDDPGPVARSSLARRASNAVGSPCRIERRDLAWVLVPAEADDVERANATSIRSQAKAADRNAPIVEAWKAEVRCRDCGAGPDGLVYVFPSGRYLSNLVIGATARLREQLAGATVTCRRACPS